MTVQEFASAVGVTSTTIYNDIKGGRIAFDIVRGAYRPIYMIDIQKNPPEQYNARKQGRPKLQN